MHSRTCLIVLVPSYLVELVDTVSVSIEQGFGWQVEAKVGPNADHAYNAARKQYSAEKLLDSIIDLADGFYIRVLGFTDLDIYVPDLNFVFGLARIGGAGAIVSTHRLKQELYGFAPDFSLLVNRARKETVHELGHTVGLRHCGDRKCVMSFSNHIGEVDFKGEDFCHGCRQILDKKLALL